MLSDTTNTLFTLNFNILTFRSISCVSADVRGQYAVTVEDDRDRDLDSPH